MDFDLKKHQMLQKLQEAKEKGLVDLDAMPILDIINESTKFYTASSCSGRLNILEVEKIGQKTNSRFLYKIHQVPSNQLEIKVRLETISDFQYQIWFQVEPPVFHVGAKTLEAAKELLHIGLNAGLRRSGIRSLTKSIIVQIWGTGHLNVPIGSHGTNYLLKTPELTTFISEQAYQIMIYNKNQLNNLYNQLIKDLKNK